MTATILGDQGARRYL